MGDKYETIGKKAKDFKDRSVFVHITLRSDRFYNGYISSVGAEYLELSDKELGYMVIFFSEISVIEPYKNREVDNGVRKGI